MNYRHAYHAGNHADVLKHIVLARALALMTKKDKPLFFLDAHAGVGRYALWGDEALKTLEWQDGVGRLYDSKGQAAVLSPETESLLAPWRHAIAEMNDGGQPLSHYPGSPDLAQMMLRPDDRMLFNELHPEDEAALAKAFARDKRASVVHGDAAIAVKANLPPRERRGLILIDPPYEQEDEARAAITMLRDGIKRFATGVFLLWYPVTGDGLSDTIKTDAAGLGLPKMMIVELLVRSVVAEGGLAGSGLIIVNPPWPIGDELNLIGPQLRDRLAQDNSASWSLTEPVSVLP
jgi:23S rRNA (adenine2030-N6)-methyltransferase